MKPSTQSHPINGAGFEMFRLSRSKEAVDVCTNTIREYFKQGLPFYRRGKAVFVSKTELEAFIRKSPENANNPIPQDRRRVRQTI